jgi:glutathione-regulated potassium-efflux system protein KefB
VRVAQAAAAFVPLCSKRPSTLCGDCKKFRTVELIRAGVDYQVRETVESAYLMGAEGLRALGFTQSEVEDAAEDIRRRDNERLVEQVQGDAMSGRDRLLLQPVPEPLAGR